MTLQNARRMAFPGRLRAVPALLLTACLALTLSLQGQTPATLTPAAQSPQWQIDAGGKMAFEIASVKQNTAPPSPSTQSSNVPLGPMDDFHATGGLLSATNFPLSQYILFAYKPTAEQFEAVKSQLPKWANTDRYDIQGRASGNPTKDQFRLMMQALLADRFKLAMHFESRELPVFELILDKEGQLGPQLKPHPADVGCSLSASSLGPAEPNGRVTAPEACGAISVRLSTAPGLLHVGARNVPLSMLATALDNPRVTGVDRPVFDRTGLAGNVDFVFEFAPPGALPDIQPDVNGPGFLEALKDQLGLKLVPDRGPVDELYIDHVEEPSPN